MRALLAVKCAWQGDATATPRAGLSLPARAKAASGARRDAQGKASMAVRALLVAYSAARERRSLASALSC